MPVSGLVAWSTREKQNPVIANSRRAFHNPIVFGMYEETRLYRGFFNVCRLPTRQPISSHITLPNPDP